MLARVADGETLVIPGFTRGPRRPRDARPSGSGRLVRPRHGRHAQARGTGDSADAEDRRRRDGAIAMREAITDSRRSRSASRRIRSISIAASRTPTRSICCSAPSAAREGFVVVTGDIGTGKTTLCRALLEQIDRTTFTALVLNPFLSEEDLLKRDPPGLRRRLARRGEARAARRREQAGADRRRSTISCCRSSR